MAVSLYAEGSTEYRSTNRMADGLVEKEQWGLSIDQSKMQTNKTYRQSQTKKMTRSDAENEFQMTEHSIEIW